MLCPWFRSGHGVSLIGHHGWQYQTQQAGPGLLLMWYSVSQILTVYHWSILIGWFLWCGYNDRQIESLVWDFVEYSSLVAVIACIMQTAWRGRICLRQVCSSCVKVQSQVFLRRDLTMVNFQSVMKSPLVSDLLTMCVMVGRQEVIISFNIIELIWSSLQLLFFIPIISVITLLFVSGLKLVSFCVSCFFQVVLWGASKILLYFGHFVWEEFSKAFSYFFTHLT